MAAIRHRVGVTQNRQYGFDGKTLPEHFNYRHGRYHRHERQILLTMLAQCHASSVVAGCNFRPEFQALRQHEQALRSGAISKRGGLC
ncbi:MULTISPECIES: hypothetical protein [Pseudomonadaceae]|uniref:hypothetical protein n=1 Tax=Pseudomonadaceae TaxID=135621 RepID=UPI001F1ADBFA|nr:MULTISPECIES: hypothetical protein [Pseudomonas]MDU9398575.1 hypothetical protein [Pseudomonas sp. zfem003]